MSIYATFPIDYDYEELDKALASLPSTPEKRALGVRLKDGSYHVIGYIVKDDDCPQEIFDEALEIMVENSIETK